jgi:hypothetical protein
MTGQDNGQWIHTIVLFNLEISLANLPDCLAIKMLNQKKGQVFQWKIHDVVVRLQS